MLQAVCAEVGNRCYRQGVFVPLERLFQRRSRADELIALKRRLVAERAPHEREAALAIRALKLRLAAAAGSVDSCASCATGRPWPRGAYDGGDCCSGRTEDLFADDEVTALAQAGTRPRDLVAPRGDHPGCAFRGPTGCTLALAHRPTVCVRYACDRLLAELHKHGRLDEVEALSAELARALRDFTATVAARRERTLHDALLRDLAE